MASVLHVSSEDEATGKRRSEIANSYIANVYFNQAISLLRRGVYAEAESSFREVLKIWPDHASSLNNLGTAVWRQGRMHEAENCYRQARALKPDDFAILNNLGNVLWDQGRLERALRWYRQAVWLKPDSPEALMNLGVVLSDLGEFDEALQYTQDSLRLAPDSADSHVNLGMTLARLGRRDEALASYEHALRLHPELPEAHRNRAYIWLARGEFERGWPEYEWRLRCKKLRSLAVDAPRWNGEPLRGRSILIYAEQGLGDVLQFIRFAALAKERGGRVTVACAESLLRLVGRCQGVDQVVDWKSDLPRTDVSASLLSLPAILGTTLATLPADIPYLSADGATIDAWRPVIARALRAAAAHDGPNRPFTIGIAWQGNPVNKVDRWRSFPLFHFEHIAAVPGVRLVSLQKGDGVEQLTDLDGQFRVAELVSAERPDLDHRDFLDTAAVMSQLDMVITPETAVAHLAGSLGVQTWVPISCVGDWRWMIDRDDSPWYPTIRLFRQNSSGDWEGVFRRMADCLRQKLGS